MIFGLSRYIRLLGWCTLLLCLWSTGDLVVDLVFEEPETISDLQGAAEDADNAAEHVLIPSARAGDVSADTMAIPITASVEHVTPPLPDPSTFQTAFLRHPPPCEDSGSSFSVPLRI